MSISLSVIRGLIQYGAGSDGYKYVVLGGVVITILNLITARFVKTEKEV
jgi:hypothetical protein